MSTNGCCCPLMMSWWVTMTANPSGRHGRRSVVTTRLTAVTHLGCLQCPVSDLGCLQCPLSDLGCLQCPLSDLGCLQCPVMDLGCLQCPVSTLTVNGRRRSWEVGWLLACLTSQQHDSVSQGRICSHNCTCCHTEIEVADQTFHLTQSQYTDTRPTSPSADPITSGAWQGSHWSAKFYVTGMTRPRKKSRR